MSYHTGTIHTVRFSGNGQYLASGADDKLVVVYRLDPNAPAQKETFGKSCSGGFEGTFADEWNEQDLMKHPRLSPGESSDGS